jgi:hypothetical protein
MTLPEFGDIVSQRPVRDDRRDAIEATVLCMQQTRGVQSALVDALTHYATVSRRRSSLPFGELTPLVEGHEALEKR